MSIWWLKRVGHHRFLSLAAIFWHGALLISGLVLPASYGFQHAQNQPCQTLTVLCLSFTVFHLLDDSSGFVFTFHFLMSESLPYSPPPSGLETGPVLVDKGSLQIGTQEPSRWSGCQWSLLCPGCAATAAAFWAGADRWPGEGTAAACDVSQSGTKTQALGRS